MRPAFAILLFSASAMAQPILPALSTDTNTAVPEIRPLYVSWPKATNTAVKSYDWGMTNAGTNHGGNTTLTNIATWAALGSNVFWIRSRGSNASGPVVTTNWNVYATNAVAVDPGYDWRAKRFATSQWSGWRWDTNTLLAPTNAQQEFRVRVRATNWWALR